MPYLCGFWRFANAYDICSLKGDTHEIQNREKHGSGNADHPAVCAESKNLIIGCIATMAIVATISTVHGHVCLDKPFTSHEHTWEIIEIKEGKEYISCPCGCMETRDHNHK